MPRGDKLHAIPDSPIATPPVELSPQAQEHYRAILASAPPQEAHHPAVTRLAATAAMLTAQVAECQQILDAEGMTTQAGTGAVKAHPMIAVQHSAATKLTSVLRAMRSLPSADARQRAMASQRARDAGYQPLPPPPDGEVDWAAEAEQAHRELRQSRRRTN